MNLTLIGYWRGTSEKNADWPDPSDFVDPAWDDQERHMVWLYVRSGTIARSYRGLSPCRFCGEQNGSMEYTDGTYLWPQGLAHYIDEHGVRPPRDFVTHAIERLDAIEAASVETEWWQSQLGA